MILRLIDLIEASAIGIDRQRFMEDRDLADLIAFRLMHVGENGMHLDPAIQARHAHLRWNDMAGMRNYLAHDYDGASRGLLWATVKKQLEPVRAMCVTELAAEQQNQGD